MKTIQQRKEYIARKSKQLDKITDAHKYTRRLSRVMLYHKLLTEIEVAEVKQIIKGDEREVTVEKLIVELETKCKSSKGFMGVYFDGVKSVDGLTENVKDEIVSIEINLDGGYEEDLFGMTRREAKGYVTKLNNFIKRHSEVTTCR